MLIIHIYYSIIILSLANLDGKIITDICRNFMKKFKMEKHNQRTKNTTKIPLGDDITSMLIMIFPFK